LSLELEDFFDFFFNAPLKASDNLEEFEQDLYNFPVEGFIGDAAFLDELHEDNEDRRLLSLVTVLDGVILLIFFVLLILSALLFEELFFLKTPESFLRGEALSLPMEEQELNCLTSLEGVAGIFRPDRFRFFSLSDLFDLSVAGDAGDAIGVTFSFFFGAQRAFILGPQLTLDLDGVLTGVDFLRFGDTMLSLIFDDPTDDLDELDDFLRSSFLGLSTLWGLS